MRTAIFHLDSFTTRRFGGNPAAVVPMQSFPADSTLQAMALENNLPATAFLVRQQSGYLLRWFSGAVELPLCGHGTLAAAAVVMQRLEPGLDEVTFHSPSGHLPVRRVGEGYALDFPEMRMADTDIPTDLAQALGVTPAKVLADGDRYLALLEGEAAVREMSPDMVALGRLDRHAIIVTAAGSGEYDIVSRCFMPGKAVPEDAVTGSAHCALAPWWAERLGKSALRAFQASRRGGEIICRVGGGRVELEGRCVFYLEGQVDI